MKQAALLLLLLAGCGETIDTEGLPSVDGYQDWYRLELTGEVPGHGTGCRWVYVNDVGRAYGHAGPYRPGTVLVKEIFEEGDCGPGDPDFISVMRRISSTDPAAARLPLQGGWLFTDIETGEDVHFDWCYLRCHQAAPWDGAWYDYGAP